MRFRVVKVIIAVFVVLFCFGLVLGAKYYVKTVQSFKTFYNKEEIKLINMQNNCYQELKKSLDDKYSKNFSEIINLTSKTFKQKIASVLGDEYVLLSEEFITTLNSIKSKKIEFENSTEYLSAKKELAELKQKIDKASESEKDGYLEEFRQKLNNITTLNTKLNNQLKSARDRLESIKASTKKMFSSKAKELISIRVELMNSTRIQLKALLSDYMLELKELNSAFNEEFKEGSFPFDVASMGDSLVAGKLENECYSEILSENFNKNAIFSENSNEIVS